MGKLVKGAFKPRDTARARSLRREATPAERQLWSCLRGSQLVGHKFSRQMPIGPYFADFLCRAANLVVELDGNSHDGQIAFDQARDAFLANNGYQVIRFSNQEVFDNLEGVVAAITQALADLPTPSPSRTREGDLNT